MRLNFITIRHLFSLLAVTVFASLLTIITCLVLAIEKQPRLDHQSILTPEHIERAKRIIDTHYSPVAPTESACAKVIAQDVAIAVNYLANRLTDGSAQISLDNHKADIYLSTPAPRNIIFNGYLNFEATIIQTAALPQLKSLRVGNLALPDFLTHLLASWIISWLQSNPDMRQNLRAIKSVQISPTNINILCHQPNNKLGARDMIIPFLSEKIRAQIDRYHMLLVNNQQLNSAQHVSLAEVLAPLMRAASKHSINGNALEENRAAILAATIYVLGMPFKLLVPDAISWQRPEDQLVTLDGRSDFAKHFIASAAITVYADTQLSDAIGLYKEITDSQHGSGFSFNDIAANHAGTKFGKKAVASKADALQLQQLVASGLTDTDLMPPWSDLPEHLSESEFKERFGGMDTAAYKKIIQEIDNRVSKLKVLHLVPQAIKKY